MTDGVRRPSRGRRGLRRRQPGVDRAGAHDRRREREPRADRGRHRRPGPPRRPRRRSGRAGHGSPARAAASSIRSGPGSTPTARSWGSASASSCCTRAATRTAPRPWGSCPAARSASIAPRRSRTSAGTRSCGGGAHPAFAGIADDADFYFVHSYVGRPTARRADELILADTEHGSRVRVRRRARAVCSASSSTPSGPGPTACG